MNVVDRPSASCFTLSSTLSQPTLEKWAEVRWGGGGASIVEEGLDESSL